MQLAAKFSKNNLRLLYVLILVCAELYRAHATGKGGTAEKGNLLPSASLSSSTFI